MKQSDLLVVGQRGSQSLIEHSSKERETLKSWARQTGGRSTTRLLRPESDLNQGPIQGRILHSSLVFPRLLINHGKDAQTEMLRELRAWRNKNRTRRNETPDLGRVSLRVVELHKMDGGTGNKRVAVGG